MNSSEPISPMFGVPVATFKIPKQEELNSKLQNLILSSEKDNKRNVHPSQKIQPEVFESNFSFFDWDDIACKAIKNLMLLGIRNVIEKTTNLTSKQVSALAPCHDSWFHITRRGGYVQPHNHPNASWSAVYCVTSGLKDAGHEDSGSLIFHNPLGSGYMFQDPTNRDFKWPYSIHGQKFTLSASNLIVFPSHLVHSVTPYFGEGERITIATNVWFK
ncbi:MAG: hypothetical protein HWD86_11095 [Kangiellaceae bacterium]|nr:hypothetical protein [Kangiellaceae bacterium]